MNIQFSPPDITESEIQEVVEVLKSGWITTGPRTKEFEKKIADYIGVPKAVCLNSATSALELTLRILGIGKGDEVITSAYTYTASASVVEHVGARLILVDTDGETFEMDYDKLEAAITPKTKVIIPVDIGGKLCNYDRIQEIVHRKSDLFHAESKIQKSINRIAIVADSAHGFGAEYDNLVSGNFADFTTFSFHAVKNLTTAEGGAVVWKDMKEIDNELLYNEYMLASLHGQSKDALAKTKLGAWEYDIVYPAYKCNMTDINAAIGLKQLKRYGELLERRRYIIDRYDNNFIGKGFKPLIHFTQKSKSSGHLYLLRIPGISAEQRNQIITKMAEKGVATNVHYKPLPMMTAYKNLGFDIADYPNAYKMYENEITLPLHTRLSDEDIDYVIDTLNEIVEDLDR
ncbi:MAG: DegT/DnrJ/EryC1/StrS aminotransferase family protein [Clostridiales bacterium]|nr:DegT/DnrJ/EryC1/StrS aminotransferase family protein [Clostridiales bacterium]MDY4061145.1 DegT/DnrJ/EryC1/StrS aminotransferase family protein [Anaerovoracaceae bacterium]